MRAGTARVSVSSCPRPRVRFRARVSVPACPRADRQPGAAGRGSERAGVPGGARTRGAPTGPPSPFPSACARLSGLSRLPPPVLGATVGGSQVTRPWGRGSRVPGGACRWPSGGTAAPASVSVGDRGRPGRTGPGGPGCVGVVLTPTWPARLPVPARGRRSRRGGRGLVTGRRPDPGSPPVRVTGRRGGRGERASWTRALLGVRFCAGTAGLRPGGGQASPAAPGCAGAG